MCKINTATMTCYHATVKIYTILNSIPFCLSLQLVSGPQICLRLRANVTMPDMQISTDVLDFSHVCCGEAKVITVQIYNHKHVRCDWNSLPSEKDRLKVRKLSLGR